MNVKHKMAAVHTNVSTLLGLTTANVAKVQRWALTTRLAMVSQFHL